MHPMYRKKGFTLIELLVVISIIGLLSSVILAGMTTARGKAQDARRKTDMRTLKNSLALYYSNNNSYPLSTPMPDSSGTTGGSGGKPISGLGSSLTGILPNPPTDPKWTGGSSYYYVSTASSYGIRMRLADGTFCKSGENINMGWWGDPANPPSTGTPTPLCPF